MDKESYKPDWSYWLNMARVKIKDACALSVSLNPRHLPDGGADFEDYKHRCNWATSAIRACDLPFQVNVTTHDYYGYVSTEQQLVTLADFRAWGESLPVALTFPDEFPIAAHGKAATARDLDRSLDTRERTTLLTIIGALAEAASLDLSQHNKAGDAVAAMLDAKGVKLSGRTIGEHLKAVREAMDSRKVK